MYACVNIDTKPKALIFVNLPIGLHPSLYPLYDSQPHLYIPFLLLPRTLNIISISKKTTILMFPLSKQPWCVQTIQLYITRTTPAPFRRYMDSSWSYYGFTGQFYWQMENLCHECIFLFAGIGCIKSWELLDDAITW